MEKRTKAIGTFALVCSLPVLFAVPQITAYPMTLAIGIVGAAAFLNMGEDPEAVYRAQSIQAEEVRVAAERAFLDNERDRAKAASCPGC